MLFTLKISDCEFHEDQLSSGITFSWSAGYVNSTVTEYVIIKLCFGKSSIQNSDTQTQNSTFNVDLAIAVWIFFCR